MFVAEATVRTDRAARYLDQFCQHAGQVHRIRAHITGGHLPTSGQVTVHRSDSGATIDFGWARCLLTASTGALVLYAEAQDDQTLQRVQDIITADLRRFGRREQLAVNWQQPRTPQNHT